MTNEEQIQVSKMTDGESYTDLGNSHIAYNSGSRYYPFRYLYVAAYSRLCGGGGL